MCSIFGLTGSRFPRDLIKTCFDRTISRGPDMSRMVDIPGGVLGFHRLAIMGLHEEGMQPFRLEDDYVVCNGELYGFRPLRARLMETYDLKSECDCEILLPLYREYGVEMFKTLDAEFALILYDGRQGKLIAARDPIGIRPLYYGQTVDGGIAFASEPKNLIGMCEKILPFPPGHYWIDGKFIQYADPAYVGYFTMKTEEDVCAKLRRLLMDGVGKRLDADAPVGFLLSGGLDSSLVCAIAQKMLDKPIRTFAIGMDIDAIDLKYARMVADYIGSDHTEVIISEKDVIEALPTVVELLGTWDITTIRASIGMYLVCKWIHENTDIRVLLTGEISDELFGYKYTDFAPSGRSPRRPLHFRQLPGSPRSLRRSEVCPLRHEHRSGAEDEHPQHGQVPDPQSLCGGSYPAGRDPLAPEGCLLRRRRPQHGQRSEGVCGKDLYRQGI